MPNTTDHYRDLFIGLEIKVPLLDGAQRTYINLDNAASTPPFKAVQKSVNDFLIYYSSVHRGTGFKSLLSTHAYEQARAIVLDFVSADPEVHTCIFGKNTTEAINKLARRFPFSANKDIVLTSGMEHHSNDLPWRSVAKTVHVGLTREGYLDEADFDAKLAHYSERIALVSVTGASNVTGYLTSIHRLAEKAHATGAMIMVDGAQLAPHRKLEMGSPDDPGHLDFVSISAHKLYAPFGTGALIGRWEIFEQGDPDMVGGGTVEIVTLDEVTWTDPPEREEAGSPNTVGAIALAAALVELKRIGMDNVASHEARLTAQALSRLAGVKGVKIYGSKDPIRAAERLGVIPLQLEGISHFLAAAILGYEFGIGVRSGCFCAHPYILHLLNVSPEAAGIVRRDMLAGDKTHMPGLIRASFGLYNTPEEVDAFVEALERISRGDYRGVYQQDKASGEYRPVGWEPHFGEYFSLIGEQTC